MQRIIMFVLVMLTSLALVPSSVFATKNYNSSRSNVSQIAKATTRGECEKAGGVWRPNSEVGSSIRQVCLTKNNAEKNASRFGIGKSTPSAAIH